MRAFVALLAFLPAVSPTAQEACEPLAAEGAERAEAKDWQAALVSLSAAVAADSLCVTPNGELAGDRLARVQLLLGDVEGALATWDRTLAAAGRAEAAGREALVGVYLDVLVRLGYVTGPEADAAFQQLLRPTRSRPPDGSPYWRLLAQVASVVPGEVAAEAFVGGDRRRGIASGRPLASWWVSKDPFPATTPNERVEEHLLRVSKALAEYPDPKSPEGYDDRGELFVRFGAPQVSRKLIFDTSDLVLGLSRLNVGVSRQSFPPNEIWTYGELDETMVYVLTARNDVYRIGQTEDLLPPVLRNVTGRGPRREALAQAALLSMQYIYGELATTSMEYGNAWSETMTILQRTASPFENPGQAVLSIQRDVAVRESERGRERSASEPPSTSRVVADTPPVLYSAEVARFLDEDGGTRLELVWQLREGTYPALRTGGVLVANVVEQPETLRRTVTASVLQNLSPEQVSAGQYVPPSAAAVACGGTSCAPAVQLALFAALEDGRPAERVGASVWRVPEQAPLQAGALEISDLRPIEAARDQPFVGDEVTPGMPLSLYFEAYGFEGGATRARVQIEYEILWRQLGGQNQRRREVPSPASGDLRLSIDGDRTRQYVIINTANWAGADEVDVRVVVRDERTGESVERTRTFQVR